ncbi:DUF2188 domain-containing protein [Caulobacter mirabilis]|nr:DUF2188 domain-containing protein [Caulobacter mirabilis]
MKHSSAKYQVAPAPTGGWAVRQDNGAAKFFSTQGEAVAAAQAAVRKAGGELTIQAANGHVKKRFTLGSSAMEKLNAVEGLTLSTKARQIFAKLDRAGASPDARRSAISGAFRKAKS